MQDGFQSKPLSNLMAGESFSREVEHSHRLRSYLEAISKLRVLVIGDGIVDEYCYVRPLGKSPKENIIATRFLSREIFEGGVWAAAKHVEGFCKSVTVATANGFTVKRRFVEHERIAKLFEVHEDNKAHAVLEAPDFEAFDIVIAADFGHGCITPELISAMTAKAKFVAVNAQTNSANHGFNLITKYPRADYVVLDELEARLAARDRESAIELVIKKLAFERMAVTLGPGGSIGYEHDEFHRAVQKPVRVVDTMGAGDAFFCVSALFAAVDAAMPLLLEVGNAAGAIKCREVGHRRAVTREALEAELG